MSIYGIIYPSLSVWNFTIFYISMYIWLLFLYSFQQDSIQFLQSYKL